MKNTNLQEIFARYLSGEASPKEVRFLLQQFGKKENETELKAAIRRQLEAGHEMPEPIEKSWESVLQDTYQAIKVQISHKNQIEDDVKTLHQIHIRRWWRYSIAAAMAVLVASSVFIFFNHKKGSSVQTRTEIVQRRDIAPGGNKAILTLSNGTSIGLDSTKNGVIFLQGNTKVVKQNNGLLSFNNVGSGKATRTLYNTITTPRGGQYEVVLSDGTKVWLNAASSIRFPNEFTGNVREVRVTGEAYFEVTDNTQMPFKVLVNDMTVQVLGTHFNVMAYKDEPVAKITLLNGAVKVTDGDKNVLLNPGEQAQVNLKGQLTKVENVDLQGTIAWKNNQFWFNGDDIQTVMRELSRWYNVNVIIKGDIPQHFGGDISRNIYVSKVFEALQATSHLQYKIQDSTIIVSP